MTYYDCIRDIDRIEPNAYETEDKIRWIRECEGMIYTDLFLQQPLGFHVDDMNDLLMWELSIPAPYNKVYRRYLQAMIHQANGEYDRYAASMQLFNSAWSELCRWFGQDYDIADHDRNRRVTVRIPFEEGPPEPKVALAKSSGGYVEPEYPVEGRPFPLLRVPPRCAFVGGRVVIRRLYINPDEQKVYGNLWFGDPHDNVGQTDMKMYKRRSYTVPVLIGDVEGSDIGITMNAPGNGEAYLTGILCVPEEQFFYGNRELWPNPPPDMGRPQDDPIEEIE